MIFSWLRRRRRRRWLREPFPEGWKSTLESLPLWTELSDEQRSRLADITRVLVLEKRWEGCGGFELDDRVRVTIAAQAALLILEIDHEYYRRVRSILVYPSSFLVPSTHRGSSGLAQSGDLPALGVAHYAGPVVLAWDSSLQGAQNADDGRNLVLHEFAHKLDMLDGYADGKPPLGDHELYKRWVRVMTEEFEQLIKASQKGRRTLIDKYGTTNPAEFFAVVTECFFEKGRTMRRKEPELYDLFATYYRQDTAAREERQLERRRNEERDAGAAGKDRGAASS